MSRHAIIHIGPMKTGSSSIQQWLGRNAVSLASQGYVVPVAFGPNMSRLAAIAEARSIDVQPTASDLARLEKFKLEIARLEPSDHTVIVSAEMLGHQLTKPEQLTFLIDLLKDHIDTFSVIVYLRRQVELSVSRYTTALRRGERRARLLSNITNYEDILDLWSGVFGSENIHPRIYDRSVMPGGDVIMDFASVTGIPYGEAPKKAIELNSSLRPEAQAFLADLAHRLREAGFDRPFETINGHNAINRILSKQYKGTGILPTRSEVIAYYGKVAASNERVRARWFPDRQTLFSEDFSAYPEDAPENVSPQALLDVAMSALAAVVTARKVSVSVTSAAVEERTVRAALDQARREKHRSESKGTGIDKHRERRIGGRHRQEIL